MTAIGIFWCLFTIWLMIYTYFKWQYSYWQRKGVPFLKPSIPFGTGSNPLTSKVHLALSLQNAYYEFKKMGQKCGGLYWFAKPILMVIHPEDIKIVLLKDFQYFTDRGVFYNEKDDPLSYHLFNIDGLSWYRIRTKLTPTFTSGKMKMMFNILEKCGEQLKDFVHDYYTQNQPIDIKDAMECFTTDVIGTCAFGLDCNSFQNPSNDFKRYAFKAVNTPTRFLTTKQTFATCYPQAARAIKICLVSQHIRQFFLDVIKDTINYRDKNNVARPDFLNILMELRQSKENENGLTITEVAAQAFVFFIAAFETSSSTMACCLYELAQHEEVQNKARAEIVKILARYNNSITYEAVMEMKYLEQVINETLRKYPPVPYLTRRCVKNYVSNSNVTIEKGTLVVIPTYALHHDPELHQDPEKFDPERFNSDNKLNIPPFSYLPFGDGPRNCIGMRFGQLQVKIGLSLLLAKFKFSLNPKTKTPLEFKRLGLLLNSANRIWLDIDKAT